MTERESREKMRPRAVKRRGEDSDAPYGSVRAVICPEIKRIPLPSPAPTLRELLLVGGLYPENDLMRDHTRYLRRGERRPLTPDSRVAAGDEIMAAVSFDDS